MDFDIKWEVLKELTETYAISGFEEDITNMLKKNINLQIWRYLLMKI